MTVHPQGGDSVVTAKEAKTRVPLVPINLLMPVTHKSTHNKKVPTFQGPEYTRRKALEPTPEGSRSSKCLETSDQQGTESPAALRLRAKHPFNVVSQRVRSAPMLSL